jgi:predicted amidohydrolase
VRLAAAHAARVVVFPELSLTGYELERAEVIATDDARLRPFADACTEAGVVALAGAPVGGAGAQHIGVLAVAADGVHVAYRKRWLGSTEAARFSPGADPGVLEVDGWRLGLAVCKDTGVEQHAADAARLGMDAYVAGVLESAEDGDVVEERAHRIATTHGVWVAVASFAGSTGGGYDDAAGGSGIWSPAGDAVVRAGRDPGAVVTATLGLG